VFYANKLRNDDLLELEYLLPYCKPFLIFLRIFLIAELYKLKVLDLLLSKVTIIFFLGVVVEIVVSIINNSFG